MSKRIFSVVVGGSILILGISLLAPLACAQRKLSFLMWSHFVPTYEEEMKRIVADFEKEYNVKVTLDILGEHEARVRTIAEAEAGKGHDIFEAEFQDPLILRKQLVPLNDLAAELAAKYMGWSPIAKMTAFYEGNWWGIPHWYHTPQLVYRTDYFNQIGESREKVWKYTWEDLLVASEKLQELGHPGGIPYSDCDDANIVFYPLLWSYGSATVDEKNNVVIDSPQTVKALKYGKKLFEYMPYGVLGWDNGSNNRHMLSGLGSWTINPPSIWAVGMKDFPEVAAVLDHAPMPAGPAGKFKVPDTMTLCIWKFSDNIELAKKFIKFLMRPDINSRRIVSSGGYNIPFLNKLRTHPYWRQNTALQACVPGVEINRLYGYRGDPEPAIEAAFGWVVADMFASVATGTPIAQAIKEAEKRLKDIYAKYRK